MGLTERTFFRHFVDKREVLFEGFGELEPAVISAIGVALSWMVPIDMVGKAMQGAASLLEGNRDQSRRHAALIAANPNLQERELLKRASGADRRHPMAQQSLTARVSGFSTRPPMTGDGRILCPGARGWSGRFCQD